jgi:hypothetical protein
MFARSHEITPDDILERTEIYQLSKAGTRRQSELISLMLTIGSSPD